MSLGETVSVAFIEGDVIADIPTQLRQRLPFFTQSTAVLKSISIYWSKCDNIDLCAITCSRKQKAMQNLLELLTEYKEVALRRDSVGSSGKSLGSSKAHGNGSYSLEITNLAECFSAQRV